MSTTVLVTNQGPKEVDVYLPGSPVPVRVAMGETKPFTVYADGDLRVAEAISAIKPVGKSAVEHGALRAFPGSTDTRTVAEVNAAVKE